MRALLQLLVFLSFCDVAWAETHLAPTEMYVTTGESKVINLNQNFGRFLIGNPEILEVTPVTPTSFYLIAKQDGKTSIQIFAANGVDLVQTLNIQAGPNLDLIRRAIRRMASDAAVEVHFENSALLISGTVADERTRNLVLAAAKGISKVDPVDGLEVAPPRQVQLKVRFLEVSRSLNGDIGVGITASGQSGDASFSATTFPMSGGALGKLSIIDSSINIDIVLKTLEEQGYAKFLAEPTLTALSGQPASFLAGGQVPITTTTADGTPITEYKDYGIQLNFTPEVDKNGRITLTLSPEVSQVDFGQLSNGSPTFSTRRASTTVKLGDRQSIVLAGLYQNDQSRNKSAVPLLSNLPVLGALFRDSQLRGKESEVMIVITPSLSFVTTKDSMMLNRMQESEPANPTAFFRDGQMEAAGYGLKHLLEGREINGTFGPILVPGHEGIFYGQD